MEVKKNIKDLKQHIFIIGAMKSGTTTLFNYLKNHPEICPPIVKEPEFFSNTMGDAKYKKQHYNDLFPINKNHNFSIDASMGYSKFPIEKGVPKRIYDYGLNPKFIYIVRNPFERIESHFNYMQKDLNWRDKITDDYLIHLSNYYLQLQEYLKYFPKSSILILDFENLKTNPIDTLNNVYTFLEINKSVDFDSPLISNKTILINRKEIKIKSKINGRLNWIPLKWRSTIKNILFSKKRHKLTTKQLKIIKDKLAEDMELFEKEFNFPVKKWGFD